MYMKRSFYEEPDYAFGQAMLTLRTTLGLTQTNLAQLLGVSRKAVGQWEAGYAYPKTERLKALLAFAYQQQVFTSGHEAEEIRAFWKVAHQKVQINESWLSTLLNHQASPPTLVPVEAASGAEVGNAPIPAPTDGVLASQSGQRPLSIEPLGSRAPAASGPRMDWGEALDVPIFYGREGELATLAQWMVQERCRMVSVLGIGGIGKSALVTHAMRQLAEHFQVVLFRSLRDAPSCEALLEECLKVFDPQLLPRASPGLKGHLQLLLEQMRTQQVLLVLDNLESLLLEGDVRGSLRPGYEDYARLLQRVAETTHQSCLVLTSREKPTALRALEGRKRPVRTLRLEGLEVSACEQLLVSHELVGSPEERARLVERYGGNPLALNIVAETITGLFGGEINAFLSADTAIFGGIAELLEKQWGRLSPLEQMVLCWLAILREPVTLEELRSVLVTRLSPMQLLEAVDGLRRRSLIERGQRTGSFTLQSVVLEFVTDRLVSTASEEIRQGQLALLFSHGLSQAGAKEYVRQTQERLLLVPLLDLLRSVYGERALVFSPDERLLATGSWEGMVKMWDVERGTLLWTGWHAGGLVENLAFDSDGQRLASCGDDATIRIWDTTSGANIQTIAAHQGTLFAIAWSPDNTHLASGRFDGCIQIWELQGTQAATCVQTLTGHSNWTNGVAFAPNGSQLASGSWDGTVRLWDVASGRCLQTLEGHTDRIHTVAWSPDGRTVASAGFDAMIWLWDVPRGRYRVGLQGHTAPVYNIAFTPDSSRLLSVSEDQTLRVWDVESGSCESIIQGYAGAHYDVVWSPDGQRLASVGSDLLVTLWDVVSETLSRALHGHCWMVTGIGWSPDGQFLASAGWDNTIRLWNPGTGACMHILRDPDYSDTVFCNVAWSPDGQLLATGSYQHGVQVWEMTTQSRCWVGHAHPSFVRGLAWSPDGTYLASCGDDGTICLWHASDGKLLQTLQEHSARVSTVAWSPDGIWLASGGGGRHGGELFLWQAGNRKRVHTFEGQPHAVTAVVWNTLGDQLVSGDNDGMLRWWQVQSGQCLALQKAHQSMIHALKISPDGQLLASCSEDGTIKVWNLQSTELVRTLKRDRPYERLNITRTHGLTEAQKATLFALGAFEEAVRN
jgi:WD40 repeat protein/transcriptional regulator with XRE-family HTH domain